LSKVYIYLKNYDKKQRFYNLPKMILAAVCRLGAKALRGWRLVLIGLAVAAAKRSTQDH
jgi:hypothetical protein